MKEGVIMKINNLKKEKTIRLRELEAGDVFELYDKFYIKTTEGRESYTESYTICVDLSDGGFTYLNSRDRVLPVEASVDITNIK